MNCPFCGLYVGMRFWDRRVLRVGKTYVSLLCKQGHVTNIKKTTFAARLYTESHCKQCYTESQHKLSEKQAQEILDSLGE